jgi:hypothetical protein
MIARHLRVREHVTAGMLTVPSCSLARVSSMRRLAVVLGR